MFHVWLFLQCSLQGRLVSLTTVPAWSSIKNSILHWLREEKEENPCERKLFFVFLYTLGAHCPKLGISRDKGKEIGLRRQLMKSGCWIQAPVFMEAPTASRGVDQSMCLSYLFHKGNMDRGKMKKQPKSWGAVPCLLAFFKVPGRTKHSALYWWQAVLYFPLLLWLPPEMLHQQMCLPPSPIPDQWQSIPWCFASLLSNQGQRSAGPWWREGSPVVFNAAVQEDSTFLQLKQPGCWAGLDLACVARQLDGEEVATRQSKGVLHEKGGEGLQLTTALHWTGASFGHLSALSFTVEVIGVLPQKCSYCPDGMADPVFYSSCMTVHHDRSYCQVHVIVDVKWMQW